MFAVAWGLLGVPFAVIVLSNLGLYLRFVERFLCKCIRRCGRSKIESSTNLLNTNNDTNLENLAPNSAADNFSTSKLSIRSKKKEEVFTALALAKPERNILPISLALFVLLHLVNIFLFIVKTSSFC